MIDIQKQPADFKITRDGTWYHDGAPIKREALAKLFAGRALKVDGDGNYWLQTPFEKYPVELSICTRASGTASLILRSWMKVRLMSPGCRLGGSSPSVSPNEGRDDKRVTVKTLLQNKIIAALNGIFLKIIDINYSPLFMIPRRGLSVKTLVLFAVAGSSLRV